MLDPIKRIGPIAEAPKIDPIPPSNKKSPDPIPFFDLIILQTSLMQNNIPYPKINPRNESSGTVKNPTDTFSINPDPIKMMLIG